MRNAKMVIGMSRVRVLGFSFVRFLFVFGDSIHAQQDNTKVVDRNGLVLNEEVGILVNQDLSHVLPPLPPLRYDKLGGRKMVVDIGLKKHSIKDGGLLNQKNMENPDNYETISSSKFLGGSQAKMKDQSKEAKRLLKDTIDIVSLMHKDYTGMGKGRRKPPIHN